MALSSAAYTQDCDNRRRCDNDYTNRFTLASARSLVEAKVNHYFVGYLSEQGLTAEQVSDRLAAIGTAAEQRAQESPYELDVWEFSVLARLRILTAGDARFASGYPQDLSRALNIYRSEIIDPDNT